MAKAKTIFHLSTNYRHPNSTLSLTFYATEKSHITVELDEERSAAAHRLLVQLCEEQLREDSPLPVAQVKRLAPPAEKEPTIDADFNDEVSF